MKTQEQLLEHLLEASDEEVLRLWRFEPIGSPYFMNGPVSDLMTRRMLELQQSSEWSALSKRVGWGK